MQSSWHPTDTVHHRSSRHTNMMQMDFTRMYSVSQSQICTLQCNALACIHLSTSTLAWGGCHSTKLYRVGLSTNSTDGQKWYEGKHSFNNCGQPEFTYFPPLACQGLKIQGLFWMLMRRQGTKLCNLYSQPWYISWGDTRILTTEVCVTICCTCINMTTPTVVCWIHYVLRI